MFMNQNIYFLVGRLHARLAIMWYFLEEVSQDEFKPKTTEAFRELLNGGRI